MTSPAPARPNVGWALGLLFAINLFNFYDRQILGAVGELLKKEWDLSDLALGHLTTAFTLLYAVVGIPFGHWADRGKRTHVLALGVTLWSILTTLSGMAWSFSSLFVMRLGVGVGEASCAPAANSLIPDLVPPAKRARAVSWFMLGLPLGLGLSFFLGGEVAKHWGWRTALILAGAPGLILGLLALLMREPARTTSHSQTHEGKGGWITLLTDPVMILLIVSGALHNFNQYALGAFISPFVQRYHSVDVAVAGRLNGLGYGLGGLGIIFGGWACDFWGARRANGRLEVSALAVLIFSPCMFLALDAPRGSYILYALSFLPAYFFSLIYYPGVYATIQDITAPHLRGRAMALYFCAMYLFGAAAGGSVTGWLSKTFMEQEAAALTAQGASNVAELASAFGLRKALMVVPVLSILLSFVLFAATWLLRHRAKGTETLPG